MAGSEPGGGCGEAETAGAQGEPRLLSTARDHGVLSSCNPVLCSIGATCTMYCTPSIRLGAYVQGNG